MIERQIICKILATGNYELLENNLITDEYFAGSGWEEELDFIKAHYKKYGNVPDRSTFQARFPEIEIVEVTESDKYLVDTIREEYLYRKCTPVINKIAELARTDSNAAVEYMIQSLKELQPNYQLTGVDLIADAQERLDAFKERLTHQRESYFTTGFPELDNLIYGLQRGEELLVLFARTNQGKSWILEKIVTHIWQLGYNVGYISPEMSANSIGYRFDTLYKNYSNKGLVWGKDDINVDDYTEYINDLKTNNNKFIVATPLDFDRHITVSKLRNFVKQYKLDVLAIDGITYLSDERSKRNDNKTTSLTNISEDLMLLSIELKIPVLVVVQANRSGIVDAESSGTPELESIRDSDGISHNASKVLSIRQKDGAVEIGVKKQRFGELGSLKYMWDINTGEFTFIPDYDVQSSTAKNREKKSGKDVF